MSKAIFALIFTLAPWAFGQVCTTRVLVNVFDKSGHVVSGLRPDYFQGRAGKTLLTVAGIQPIKNNRVLVLVDASGSAEEPKVAESVRTIADVTRQAPRDMPVAFGIFGERVFLSQAFASDAAALNSQIDSVMIQLSSPALGRYPALFDALHEALSFFGTPEPGDTILLASRGLNYGSKRSAKDLTKEFSNAGVRLLVMTGEHLNQTAASPTSKDFPSEPNNPAWDAGPGTVRLLRLAQQTGGSIVGFIGPRWFTAAGVGYAMKLECPSTFRTAKDWSLKLTRAGQNAVGPVRIVRPLQLPPCVNAPTR